VNCACTIGTRLNLDLLFVAQNGVVLELHLAKTTALASLQPNGLKWATTMKAMSFCAQSSSITALVRKLH